MYLCLQFNTRYYYVRIHSDTYHDGIIKKENVNFNFHHDNLG